MTTSAENWAAITQSWETFTGDTKPEDNADFPQGWLTTAAFVQGHRCTETC